MVRCWENCSDANASFIFAVFFRAAELRALLKTRSGEINELVFAHFSFGIIKPSFGLLHIFSHINHSATPQSIAKTIKNTGFIKEFLKTGNFFINNLFIPIISKPCSLGIWSIYNIACDFQKRLFGLLNSGWLSSFLEAMLYEQTLFF